ncbi:cytochrome c [Prosthecochloris sp. SCSIO W1101]|uniref:c-type cytochrome n=1 Tax=Prosthecochloris sp. SCSIO W1101 TaxID=2992242 RepID=UPI00223DE50C|nr:cytochrome c [Prosthecochloris sp. SCSIO W1101]UZJ41218.1 cytochrome c [Prosthecochloris sp. SCSIO W1101]
MKRFFSPLALGASLIVSTTTFSACQQQTDPVPEKQPEAVEAPKISAETNTRSVPESNPEIIAQKEAAEAARQEAETIYQNNCQSCHSMTPPATSAPPIVALAGQYRARYSKKAGAVADMVSFMKEPSVGKSILGSATFERFGLMPAISLPDEELEKVAGWLWDQYDPNFQGGGDCQ